MRISDTPATAADDAVAGLGDRGARRAAPASRRVDVPDDPGGVADDDGVRRARPSSRPRRRRPSRSRPIDDARAGWSRSRRARRPRPTTVSRELLGVRLAARERVVGERHVRADEHVVGEPHAVPQLHAALDRDAVADDHVVLDEHVVADVAVGADPRAGQHVRERPHPGAVADGGRSRRAPARARRSLMATSHGQRRRPAASGDR